MTRIGQYVMLHWRGELPLPLSFWLNAPLAVGFIWTAGAMLALLLARVDFDYQHAVFYAFYPVVSLPTEVWLITGVWRAANRHALEKDARWANAAKAAMALRAVSVVVALFAAVPAIRASLAFVDEVRASDEFEIRLRQDGEIELIGGVGRGLAAAFVSAMDAHPDIKTVHTNLYRGGRLNEALTLREEFRKRKLDTFVSGACRSACFWAFLGGERRIVRRGSRLGIHMPRMPGGNWASEWFMSVQEADSLASLGVSRRFARRAMSVKQPEMWYPTDEELLEAGAVTEFTDTKVEGAPHHLASETSAVEKMLLAHRAYHAVRRDSPLVFDYLISRQVAARAMGETDQDAAAMLQSFLTQQFTQSLPFAGDDVLIRHARLTMEQIRYVNARSPSACLDMIAGHGYAKLPDWMKEEDASITAEVLESADPKRRMPTRADYDPLIQRAHERALIRTSSGSIDASRPRIDDSNRCEFTANLYEQLSQLPKDQAATALRGLLLIAGAK